MTPVNHRDIWLEGTQKGYRAHHCCTTRPLLTATSSRSPHFHRRIVVCFFFYITQVVSGGPISLEMMGLTDEGKRLVVFLKGLTVPHLCRFEKWTLGMNRTGWVSRSVSGLRNVISFPLKPESKQPFRPTDGKSSSSQFAWQFKRQLHTERGKCPPKVSQQKY